MAHTIREYTHADTEAVKNVLSELQDFERVMDPQRLAGLEIAHMYLEHLLKLCEDGQGKIFVVEVNDGVVGMVSVYIETDRKHMRKSTKFARIADLMVLPEFRSEGVTKELLQKAESYASSKGVTDIQAKVLTDHADGVAGYLRNGYHQYEVVLRKQIE